LHPPFLFMHRDKEVARYELIASAAYLNRLLDACSRIAELDAPFVLIKGWAVGRFYPEARPRLSTDFDFVVSETRCEDVRQWALSYSFSAFGLDIHCGFGDRDPLPFDELFARSKVIELGHVGIRVLADEDNLRLTAAHWLIDGGIYKDKLWDIYYLVKNRKAEFDWDLCLNAAGPVRRTWVLTAIATARDYLDLDVSDLPTEIREFELPRWYKAALRKEWRHGPYLRMPIKIAYRSPKHLFEQFRRRFPPNAIAATCDTESPFDDSPRWPLQLKSLRKRLMPYLRRS
jgi:hypothetical protein